VGDSEGRWRQEGPVVLLLSLLLLVWVVRVVVLCVDRTGHRDLVIVAATAVVLMIVVVIVVGWGEGISSVDGQPRQTSDARDVHGSGLRRSLWTGTERSGGIGREDRRRVRVAVVLAVLVAVVVAGITLLLLLLSWVCGECSGGASQRGERPICLLASVLLLDLLLLISWKRKRKRRRGRRRSGQDQHERNRHDRLWLMMQ